MANKLSALRTEMQKLGIDAFFVPRADQFQGEYVPASNNRLEWITGFSGSAGFAIIAVGTAAFFTDGRYTVQAKAEVNSAEFNIYSTAPDQGSTPTLSPNQWIEANLKPNQKLGIDPWLHTPNDIKGLKATLEKIGAELVYLETNPLDLAWHDRPAPPQTPAVSHPLQYSGVPSLEKRQAIAKILQTSDVDTLAITLPEEICWLLNIRGDDVPHTPFTLSYGLLHNDSQMDWFVDAAKITATTRDWIGADVRIHPLENFSAALESLAKLEKTIWLDPAAAPIKVQQIINMHGGELQQQRSPIQLMKAKKNKTEIQGTINAHIRDGVAVTRFLTAICAQGGAAKFDELSASDLLESFRRENELFKDLSFDTISGAAGNGAIVHYRSSPATNKPLTSGPVYLVDSGGQYLDGTTDITRTLAVDNVTAEMKDRYTRVLKGHIQVATSVFPEGTTGDKLDVKARAALKEVGLDYAHGTGHGVGSYLSVHEGPCGISPRSTTVPLEEGMIISNEPGYYKEGEYGIRIENLVLVIDTGKKDSAGKKLLGFKTLTMAPIDINLIEPSLLTDTELSWLNTYHAEVRQTLLPLLEKKDPLAATFLKQATEPLQKASNVLKFNNFQTSL